MDKRETMKTTNTNTTPATVTENVKALLQPFTKSRGLLKEWTKAATGYEFDELQKIAFNDLVHFFGNSFKFTAGSRPYFGNDFRAYEVGDLFGLPYTSSGSDFAALWNTNTEARTRSDLAPLFFRGIAIQPREDLTKYKKFDFIYIFNSLNEKYFYFTACEFLQVFDQVKKIDRAARYAQFIKDINAITPQAVEVLKKYNGKKCGEKTREKIRQDINAITEATAPAVRLWLDFAQYSPALRFSYGYNTYKKDIYFNFYNFNNNIIELTESTPAPLKEFDPVEALQTLKEKAKEAQQVAAALLSLLDEYNTAARLLDLPSIPTTRADVSALAKYGAESAARD